MTLTNGTGPSLPKEVWNPILAQVRDWMMPATEAPEEYIFASAFSVIGLAIGRDVYVQMGRRLYANRLVALIPRSFPARRQEPTSPCR